MAVFTDVMFALSCLLFPFFGCRDAQHVKALQQATEDVKTMIDQIYDILLKIYDTKYAIEAELKYRIWFHDFHGLRCVKRAIIFGFVQAWEIEQQNTFEPVSTGSKDFMRLYRKSLKRLLAVPKDQHALHEMIMWLLDEEIGARRELVHRVVKAMWKIHMGIRNGTAINAYSWAINPRYDDNMVPVKLLNHREQYQELVYNHTESKLEELQNVTSIVLRENMYRVLETGEFNETFFKEIRLHYEHIVDEFTFNYNLFRDTIVYRVREIIEQRREDFKRINETFYKELKDTEMTIIHTQNLLQRMDNLLHRDINKVVQASKMYITDTRLNKTALANQVLSPHLTLRVQQMRDLFNDIRARARTFEHNWLKFQSAYVSVWRSMKTEDTLQPFYKQLHEDFRMILDHPELEESKQVLAIFLREHRLHSQDPYVLYQRTNADLANISEHTHVQEITQNLSRIMEESNIADLVNNVDDVFFDAITNWASSLRTFLEESVTDESFFK